MRKRLTPLFALFLIIPHTANSVTRYQSESYSKDGVSISLMDPTGTVYQEGDQIRFAYRCGRDGYMIVFDIDTEGYVHLLHPREGKLLKKTSPYETQYLPSGPNESFVVSGAKGMEFVFALFVPRRADINEQEIGFLAKNEDLPDERKFRIDGDPFLAANRIASNLVRGISRADGVRLAFTYFFVNESVDYPRYLCEDCDKTGKDPYAAYSPSFTPTSVFEVSENLTYPLGQAFVGPGMGAVEEEGAYAMGDEEVEGEGKEKTEVHVYHRTYVYRPYFPYSYGLFYPWTYYDVYCYDPWYSAWGFYSYYPYYYGSGAYLHFGFSYGWPWYRSYYDPYCFYDPFFHVGYRYRYHHAPRYTYRSLRPQYRFKSAVSGGGITKYRGGDGLRTPTVRYKGPKADPVSKKVTPRGHLKSKKPAVVTHQKKVLRKDYRRPVHKLKAVRRESGQKIHMRSSGYKTKAYVDQRRIRTMHLPRTQAVKQGNFKQWKRSEIRFRDSRIKNHKVSPTRSTTHIKGHTSRHRSSDFKSRAPVVKTGGGSSSRGKKR